jgi:putative ABC transport system permease protein
MLKWIKLAFRNILRNKRRSLVTIMAIGVGFAAVSLYHGYIYDAYEELRWFAICGEEGGLGHLRINKAGWRENGKLEPEKYMFSKEETRIIIALLKEEKDVVLASPQTQFMGLVSNGVTSAVFIAQGVVPTDEKFIEKFWFEKIGFIPEAYETALIGERLSEEKNSGVLIAKDLADYLNMKPGDSGAVMLQTLAGQTNAMDIQISGVYDTGNDFSNDKFMRFHFNFTQSLLDTQSAERILVLLTDWKKTESMRAHLLKKFKQAGIDCEIRTWEELSMGYSKMKSYLDTLFIFVSSIVLVIVITTIMNTMGMAILERTREIGTLRALGLKRKGVRQLFALEGAVMGLCGSIWGMILHLSIWMLIRLFPLQYTPPGFSIPVDMRVAMVPWALFVLLMCLILLSTIAAIVPARRTAKKNIVDALGHT